MEEDLFNTARYLRRAVLLWLSFILAGASIVITFLNLTLHQPILLISIEVLFGFFSALMCFYTYRNYYSKWLSTLYCYTWIIVVTINTSYSQTYHGAFIWATVFPLMFYLVLGRKHGSLATLIGLIFTSMATLYRAQQINDEVNTYISMNFLLCYLCIWAITHTIEVKRNSSDQSLGQLASRDSLTGVYNRHALVHHFGANRTETKQHPMSLLILDLDFFKSVNDQHGHDVGDKVLIQAANLIDTYSGEHAVYRIGGEEFCITLKDTGKEKAIEKAERIRKAIAEFNFSPIEKAISLTASIGVYQYTAQDKLESVLQMADVELYKAKKNGRNQVMVNISTEQMLS